MCVSARVSVYVQVQFAKLLTGNTKLFKIESFSISKHTTSKPTNQVRDMSAGTEWSCKDIVFCCTDIVVVDIYCVAIISRSGD